MLKPQPHYYEDYKHLIYKFVGQYHFPADLVQDAISAGYLGISKALKSFDKKKNVKFSTWCFFRIRKEIQNYKELTYLISSSKEKRQTEPAIELYTVDFLDEVTAARDNTYQTIEDNDNKKLLLDCTRKLNKKFDSRDTKIFVDYYYYGLDKVELSRKYRLDLLNLHNKLEHMLKTVREVYKDTEI